MHRPWDPMWQAVWTVESLPGLPACLKQGTIKPGLMTRAQHAGENPQTGMSADGFKKHSCMAGLDENKWTWIHKKKRQHKLNTPRKSRAGIKTHQSMYVEQTDELTVAIETLNVLKGACAGYQYKTMKLENPSTDTDLTSHPVMS
ncbi:reverse transcriptase [Phytophthora megakarya]|uniref:Reverse transcriptase n=1 Tax=Phytophthora megakarya TaxID=4795 RepID=A0A225WYS6_9STRA|nr:reverse transcriptase [Phytophthora megakarya]